MSLQVASVKQASLCAVHGVRSGDLLVSVNGHDVRDTLDYGFYTSERRVSLLFERAADRYRLDFVKGEYEDLGLEFATFLGDRHKGCKNKCVFCFIDQLPKGMRESLYFKDDDERLSYLLGNYITLTNLTADEVDKICAMKLSPMNISVHTTNPQLRVQMMKNPAAATSLECLKRFDDASISMNFQLVLCPGINDGDELRRSLNDLYEYDRLLSAAVVPVGITAHRQGLTPITPYNRDTAREVLSIIDEFEARYTEKFGEGSLCAADEFYLLAERELPPAEFYGDFNQLENGVGMLSLLSDGFEREMNRTDAVACPARALIITGEAAFSTLSGLVKRFNAKYSASHRVKAAKNLLFGGCVTVTGLLGGSDVARAAQGESGYDRILLCSDMLRANTDVFLDDMTVTQLAEQLGTDITTVANDAQELFKALCAAKGE